MFQSPGQIEGTEIVCKVRKWRIHRELRTSSLEIVQVLSSEAVAHNLSSAYVASLMLTCQKAGLLDGWV